MTGSCEMYLLPWVLVKIVVDECYTLEWSDVFLLHKGDGRPVNSNVATHELTYIAVPVQVST